MQLNANTNSLLLVACTLKGLKLPRKRETIRLQKNCEITWESLADN